MIDLDKDHLTVLWGVAQGGRVEVQGTVSVVRPEGVPVEDAKAVGGWIAGILSSSKAPSGRVVLSMPRGDVVLKRLTLPSGEASAADVGGMVRLQMTRQLTMPMEGTAVDYVLLNQAPPRPAATSPAAAAPSISTKGGAEAMPGVVVASGSGGGGSGAASTGQVGGTGDPATTTSVMAAALPADRVRWCRELAEAGELGLRRIGLRCYGASALLAERSLTRAGPVLGMTVGWCSVEFVIVEDGALTFARAVDLARPASGDDAEAYAEKIAVEAKRTWMSHRATNGSPEVEVVSVLGGGRFGRIVAERSAAQLGCGHELVGVPSSVVASPRNDSAGIDEDLTDFLPHLGLLTESMTGAETLDFSNPRRAPDLGRAKRTKVLAAVLGAILVAGGGYVASLQSLEGMGSRVRASKEREAALKKEYDEFLVKHARAAHVDQWSSARVDWLAYLALLNEQLPPSDLAVMDGLGAHMSAEVVFTARSSSYPDGTWLTRQAAAFSLDGKMSQRAVAADLRGRLLDLNFDNVESKGPDIPDHFSFVVTTTQRSPRAGIGRSAEGASEVGKGAGGGGKGASGAGSGAGAGTAGGTKSERSPKNPGGTAPASGKGGAD